LLYSSSRFIKILTIAFCFLSSKVSADTCLSFIPYFFENQSHKLVRNKNFCVDHLADFEINFKSDKNGARILSEFPEASSKIYFGDSQLLGLDVNAEDHYFYSEVKSISLHATPNNGPYEALELVKERELPPQNIHIAFNFGRDIFRILPTWDPSKYVLFSEAQLDRVTNSNFTYNLVMMKKFFQGKVTFKPPNNKGVRNRFLSKDENHYTIALAQYFNALKALNYTDKFSAFYVYPPFWVFDADGQRLLALDPEMANSYQSILCSQLETINSVFETAYVMDPSSLDIHVARLTKDMRHFSSADVVFIEFASFCSLQ
jgi:hypothetical protein